MTPEGVVKSEAKIILNRFRNVWYYMPVQTGYGRQGIPDIVVCIAGHFLMIECKSGQNKPTPLQRAVGHSVQDAGGTWMLLNEDLMGNLDSTLLRMGGLRK